MLAFFVKKLVFFVQKSTFTQSNSVRAMLKIFKFCFQVLYGKRLLLLKTYFCRLCVRNPASGLLKLAKIRKMTMTSQFFDMTSTSQFFWCCFVSLVNFSYWSKFHVNIITDSRIMTIFFYKGLTRNPEIGNTPVWVLPNIWRLGWVMDTKFSTNVSTKMLLNAAKRQGYSFYHFWVITGKPTGGGGLKLPSSPLPRLGLKPHISCSLNFNKASKEIHFQRKFEVNMGHY